MAITTRTPTTASSVESSNQIILNRPAGLAVGDVMHAHLAADRNLDNKPGAVSFTSIPAGWTAVSYEDGAKIAVFEKVVANPATEPASYTWTFTTNEMHGVLIPYVGAGPSVRAKNRAASTITATVPRLIAQPTLGMVVATMLVAEDDAANQAGTPTGYTARASFASSSSHPFSMSVSDKTFASAGIVGVETKTFTKAISWYTTAVILPDLAATIERIRIMVAGGSGTSVAWFFRSLDGDVWDEVRFSSNLLASDVAGDGQGTWVASGTSGTGGVIARSTDEGVTWTKTTPVGSYGQNFDHVAYGAGAFIVLTTTGYLLRSTDGGATWVEAHRIRRDAGTTVSSARGVVKYANGWFVATADDAVVARSSDGGLTWDDFQIPGAIQSSRAAALAYDKWADRWLVMVGNVLWFTDNIEATTPTWTSTVTTGTVADYRSMVVSPDYINVGLSTVPNNGHRRSRTASPATAWTSGAVGSLEGVEYLPSSGKTYHSFDTDFIYKATDGFASSVAFDASDAAYNTAGATIFLRGINVPKFPPGATTLSSPADGATDTSVRPTLRATVADPDSSPAAEFEISTVSDFTNVVASGTGDTVVSGTVSQWRTATNLLPNTQYYWRARGVSEGLTGSWSATRTFTTAPPITAVFGFTGAVQTYVVPADITEVTVDLYGAAGGDLSGTGGLGGRTQGTVAVTPGETLNIYCGGVGANGGTAGAGVGVGGFNGGGSSTSGSSRGGGGGGATDVRRGGTALANRVAVAAGAGGGSSILASDGGSGGGTTGGAGAGTGTPGQGGTQSAGGTTGGGLGVGGSSASTSIGGGGGGYYGGGAGSVNPGSGGGGSALVPAGGSTTAGVRTGDGTATISYLRVSEDPNTPPTAPTLGLPAADAVDGSIKGGFTFTWTHNDVDGQPQNSYAFKRTSNGVDQWWNGNTWLGSETYVGIATQSVTFPSGAWDKGIYTWTVSTTDALGGVSPYAAARNLTVPGGLAMLV